MKIPSKCPSCGTKNKNQIEYVGQNHFTCCNCGHTWQYEKPSNSFLENLLNLKV